MDIKISAFKHFSEVNNPYNRDVFKCLERIRTGSSKDKIIQYRETGDVKIKQSLPGYCFSGIFSNRSKIGLKKHSGLLILDFDHLEDVQCFKDSIIDLPFVFSAFISPGGDGLKVLIRIPPEPENHKLYYNSIYKYFDHPNLDESGKDVSRFCFESYDPEIYINPECDVWIEKEEEEFENVGSERDSVSVPLTSENKIISRLQTWFDKKYGATKGSRNQNIFKFAFALHDFGIQKSVARAHLMQYSQKDFNEKEIEKIIESAYKRKPENFGSKYFEDHETKIEIEKQVRAGKKKIKLEHKIDGLDEIVENVKEQIQVDEFWYYDDKNKIRLSPHKYKFYLEQNNFLKYFPTDSNTFTFIQKDQNLIEETNEKRIKDFVLEDLISRKNIGYSPYDFMAGNPGYFNINFLSMVKSGDINLKEDTNNECYLYFKNCAVEVSKNEVKEIDYLDLDGYVWKNQIIDREFKKTDHHQSEFRTFLWRVSGEEVKRYNSLKSVIGYLLHSYKTSSKNKAIIFNDETISDNPNGGSGKGLIWNALAKMKKVSMIDGKTFEFSKSFPYQTVSTDCQILVFDDVKKNFSFESLFSVITEGITLEYKGQDAIKIPVEKSPKILITTNYTIGGVGGSFDRRKFEVELSSHFGAHHTPEDEFGHMLFDDWDDAEWTRFDMFMINCLQYYLENGLVSHDFKNLEVRKFIKNTNMEFYEWTKEEGNIQKGIRLYKPELYSAFLQDYPDYANGKYKLSQKRFKQYLEEYARYIEMNYLEGKDHNGRWCEIYKDEPTPEIEEDNNGIEF